MILFILSGFEIEKPIDIRIIFLPEFIDDKENVIKSKLKEQKVNECYVICHRKGKYIRSDNMIEAHSFEKAKISKNKLSISEIQEDEKKKIIWDVYDKIIKLIKIKWENLKS